MTTAANDETMPVSQRFDFDDENDVAIIDGVRVAAHVLSAFTNQSQPGHWFRVMSRNEYGVVTIETQVVAPREQRRVVCAAIRAADGDVLLGIRHYSPDMHRQIDQRFDGAKFKHRHDADQGFVDQHSVFMSRAEAFHVARQAGQFIDIEACREGLDEGWKLYSEGLY